MAEPNDIKALQRQIAELQAQLAAAQRIETQGGTVFEDSVSAGGHVIGRDFINIVHQAVHAGEDPEEAKSVIAAYLHALALDLARLRLGEIDSSIDPARQEPLQLGDIYVPLGTHLNIPAAADLADWLAVKGGRSGLLSRPRGQGRFDPESEERGTRPVPVEEALATHRALTLLGKPGSGKSTFGAHVLLALAEAWQGRGELTESLGEAWTHGALLPIRVVLRQFAEYLGDGKQPGHAGDLWKFIARDFEQSGYGLCPDPIQYVQRIARTHGALFLLDGLDECGQGQRRARVLAAVAELEQTAGPNCRFLLTARPYAWPDGPDPARGVYLLADFDADKIERFIHAWYASVVRRGWLDKSKAEPKRDDLLQARERPDLRALAGNPLLLTLMATLHTHRGRLPDDRADLYDGSVELLLLHWNKQCGADQALLDQLDVPGLKLRDLRQALEKLAFQLHEQNVGRDGTADVGEHRLVQAFCPLLGGSWDKARQAVDYIDQRAGLLIGLGEKEGERQFTFPHRTFQEFLAACHLASRETFAAECQRLARTAPAHWQLVLALAARLAKAERGAGAADALVGRVSIADFQRKRKPEATDWTCAVLAANQLLEIGLSAVRQGDLAVIADRVAGWLAAALPVPLDQGSLTATQRAQAGDLLAKLGDPRFHGPERFCLPADDRLGFVRIPADPAFRIGTRRADKARLAEIVGREAYDVEINDAPTPTPEFYIAHTPVTVAQYRAFVEATGFKPGDADALRDPDHRPVRWVDWHEALAYCEWLNRVLATEPVLAGTEAARLVRSVGWRVALPSELEWEKAARGGLPGRFYPWGDELDPERANYNDTGIGDSSAVGCFPPNGYGLHDMAGNVWEWTRSLWGKDSNAPEFVYPYVANDPVRENPEAGNEVCRVVRGGAWSYTSLNARCAFRHGFQPGGRSNNLGFRVVLRSSPVS